MNKVPNPYIAAATIKQLSNNFLPKVGIVLGSGLGNLANSLEHSLVIPYQDLAGFPHVSVAGHRNQLVLGKLAGTAVACLQGRAHAYENQSYEEIKTYIRSLKLLGCQYLIVTNAAGSLHFDVGPGELMLIHDHINFQPGNPLAGPNQDEFGPRFPAMDSAYNMELNKIIKSCANELEIRLHGGVYISVLGPSYETAAEIRAFRQWGADAVGMSTVPEVIIANHCGLKVAAIAIITNYATGLTSSSHDHQQVIAIANQAEQRLTNLLTRAIGVLHD